MASTPTVFCSFLILEGNGVVIVLATSCWKGAKFQIRGMKLFGTHLKIFLSSRLKPSILHY